MFWEIFKFEILYRIKRPATYAYFGIMLLMCFLFISTDAIQIGGSVGMVFKNSPFVIYRTVLVMNIFAALICSAIMGVPVFRDFDHQIHEIYYTTPVSKRAYWFGRFAGSYVITVLVLCGMLAGIFLGTLMPWVDATRIAPFSLAAYWQPFVQSILPNAFILGSLFFISGALSRSMLVIYMQGIVFLVLYLISNTLIGDVDNSYTAALLDPLGLNSFGYITRYWTPAEKNTQFISLVSVIGLNRLIWVGIALALFLLAYRWFSFSATAPVLFARFRKNRQATTTAPAAAAAPGIFFTGVRPAYNTAAAIAQWWAVTRFELVAMLKSVPFLAIVFLGMFNLVINLLYANRLYGVQTLPVTSTMAQTATDTFSLFTIIILVFYTGELVWRERSVRINQISDALPIRQNTLLAGKFTAMVAVLTLLQLVVMLTSIVMQAIQGYYHFDPAMYLKALFVRDLWSFVVWVCFAFAVHTLANNKFTGHGIVILLAILNSIVFRVMGWWHNLYLIGSSPSVTLSEMNGFGHFLTPTLWFGAYWLIFGAIMLLIASNWWVRSSETGFGARLRQVRLAQSTQNKLALPVLAGLFVLFGGFIYYNTNIINTYEGKKTSELNSVNYEKQYKRYENTPQPRIQRVLTDVDIYPDERQLHIKGSYVLKNTGTQPIDTLVYQLYNNRHLQQTNITVSVPWQPVLKDTLQGFYVFKMNASLLPGDSMQMNFEYRMVNKGFENDGGSTDVVYNGTFFNNSYMPLLGYQPDAELTDPDLRRKYKLPQRPRLYAMADTAQYNNQNYLSGNAADWINYQTTVSTSADQIAIAPGYLQKEWTENNRRYFTYSMDSKILNFYSFLSARYEVKKDKWNDVNIEIYYHKGHNYNIDKMIDAIKQTLTYCTNRFGPYQHKQVRILEFPRYASFAQSFPNTIPYSEGIGFVLDIDPENDIDMTYYITSHEVAHQWWGHQVVGAPVQGATVMSESLAQYTALMVMQQQYGKNKMSKFLRYELDRYLRARGSEREKEQPLLLNENQQYIHYQKGSLSMYALQDLIGEQATNTGIRNYLNRFKFSGPPYSNAYQFYEELMKQTPDTLKNNVDDLFNRITLFDNQCRDAQYQKTPDGNYLLHLKLTTRKLYADSLGQEQEAKLLNEWIDVGAVSNKEVIFSKRVHVTQPDWEVTLTLPQLPEKAGIDPLHKIIDRNLDDNLKTPVARQ